MRHLTLCIAACCLVACSPALQKQQLVMVDAQATLTSANNTIADYGIAKGIAQVAETGLSMAGQPVLSAGLGALVAASDAQVAKLQAAVQANTIDLASVQSLVASLNAKIQALRLQAAPSITVVANSPAAATAN